MRMTLSETTGMAKGAAGLRGKALTAADFTLPDSEIEELVLRNVRQALDVEDPKWREVASKEISRKRLGIRTYLRRLLTSGRNVRKRGDVGGLYEEFWTNAQTADHVSRQDNRTLAVRWRDRGMLASPQLLRQVHIAYLMHAIETIRPQRALEVGCGNANVLFALAARFPEIEFAGVELTAAGVAAAKKMQAEPDLPQSFAAASPQPLRDLTAHRRVDVRQGDARALPFPDRSFDLVYTRLALEQMEEIRGRAMKEVARVADKALVLIEPWRDFNIRGPGRDYIRRQGYFAAKARHLARFGFAVVYASDDIPQKVQFSSGPVVALRK